MIGKSKPQPLIVILGPTAAGKTGLAIKISQALNGEIIGADSRQVYRYMDIGTAKPTLEERQQIVHHLIDFVMPDDNLSLARYQHMAYTAIDDIHARQRLPLLVGGTGQYISAVTEGWSIPQVSPNEILRAELESFAVLNGAEALYQKLLAIDPAATEKIHPNNVRRVIRALEVCYETGQLFSELQRKKPPPYAIFELGLMVERQTLYERADHRVDQMMAQGFVQEVQSLLDKGYNRALPSLSGLGYAQLAAHLLDGLSLEQAVIETKNATHDFIRRQLTWFRGHDNGIIWHNGEQITGEVLIQNCAHWLKEHI